MAKGVTFLKAARQIVIGTNVCFFVRRHSGTAAERGDQRAASADTRRARSPSALRGILAVPLQLVQSVDAHTHTLAVRLRRTQPPLVPVTADCPHRLVSPLLRRTVSQLAHSHTPLSVQWDASMRCSSSRLGSLGAALCVRARRFLAW